MMRGVPTIPDGARRLRSLELALVLWIAFSGSLTTSLYAGFLHPGVSIPSDGSTLRTGLAILGQIGALAVVGYVIFRQGRGLSAIGLAFWKALPISAALYVAALLASSAWGMLLGFGYRSVTGHPLHLHPANTGFLHGRDQGWSLPLLLVYVLINPIKEEMIARAYTMSEVHSLTGRWWAAILASVALQVCYHFYQGIFAALSYIALFLVFALYFARTRLILPVILAHLYFDLFALGH